MNRQSNILATMGAVCTALLWLCAALPCAATDQALLRNGFAIEHERRAVLEDGSVTRLYLADGGKSFVDVATSEIVGFEKVDRAPVMALAPAVGIPPLVNIHSDIAAIVSEASARHGVDADLIRSVIHAESSFKTKAVSRKGARGLMQLMPSTAQQLGVSDAFDARANVMGGTRYLRDLLVKYDNDMVKALAAYNAGPQRVKQYKGVPPYRETRTYVAQIVREFNRAKIVERKLLASRTAPESSVNLAATSQKTKVQKNTSIHE